MFLLLLKLTKTRLRCFNYSCRCNPSCAYLELVLLVFGALVEGPVVSEPPNVIKLVEALDVVGNAVSLQHVLTFWDGSHRVDLQV